MMVVSKKMCSISPQLNSVTELLVSFNLLKDQVSVRNCCMFIIISRKQRGKDILHQYSHSLGFILSSYLVYVQVIRVQHDLHGCVLHSRMCELAIQKAPVL